MLTRSLVIYSLTGGILYEKWNGRSISYKAGKRIRFNGVLYKVLQDHTSKEGWTPESAPSLFAKVLIPDSNIIPEWEQPDSINGYSKGDRVTLYGIIYESQVDNNVWKPGDVGENTWKSVE